MSDIPSVGGKNASLGELAQTAAGGVVGVADGFAVTAEAFRAHMRENDLEGAVYGALERLDPTDVEALAREGRRIRELVRRAPLPKRIAGEIATAYAALSGEYGAPATDVAVRSSATAEDLPGASFAGQHETYINVRGREALLASVRDCMASLFTDRAIAYRFERGFAHRSVALSVGVQKMVRSDVGCSGVIFTLDTETGFRNVVLVTAAYGLGETVVQGQVDPDEFWVHKETLARVYRPIVRRELGAKATRMIYAEGGSASTRTVDVAEADRHRFALSDDEVLELSRAAIRIERHCGEVHGHAVPMDIEWAKDGLTGKLYVLQARPETVHSRKAAGLLSFCRTLDAGGGAAGPRGDGEERAATRGTRAPGLRDVRDPEQRHPRR